MINPTSKTIKYIVFVSMKKNSILTLSGQSRRNREVLLCNAAFTIVAIRIEQNK
jgi:hypothetical protein